MRWSIVRLFAVIVGVTGIAAGFIVNVDRAVREGWNIALVLSNYFSLFTIVTTILCVVALTAALVWVRGAPRGAVEPRRITLPLAVATGPMLLLGVVFNALLRGEPTEAALGDAAGIHLMDVWATEALHVVLPLLLVADLLFAPRRRGLGWRALPLLVAYPIVWLGYTLLRATVTPDPTGASARWYPYGFLDPATSGWGGVVAYIAAMLVAIDAGIIALGRFRSRHTRVGVDAGPGAPRLAG